MLGERIPALDRLSAVSDAAYSTLSGGGGAV